MKRTAGCRLWGVILAALLSTMISLPCAHAQELLPTNPDNGGGNTGGDGATPADNVIAIGPTLVTQGNARPDTAFPRNPHGFWRGHGPAVFHRGPAVKGFYFHFFLLVVIIGLFLFWVNLANWVHEDSESLDLRTAFWNTWVLLGGMAGFLIVLFLPKWLGLLPLLAFTGVPLGLYIKERNEAVPASARVMTRDHLRNLLIKKLAAIGIKIGNEQVHETALGPPIRFMGKSEGNGRNEGDFRSKQVENSRGYMAAKELIYDAIVRRGTDVHLEPKDEELSVRVRIDGVMYPVEPFDIATGRNVLNIFKVLGGMDITERRRPQDGSFRAETEGREIDFRSATQGTRHGEKLSLRILDQGSSVGKLADLGFRKQLFDHICNSVHQPHGMFLSCGPTGAGKSTTLYAALNELDAHQSNIITVEDPVEYKMNNVNQIEINRKSGQSFASALRSILRQDPDVVMIGEIRDNETAGIACQAANTGHMVFSTVHANDTITALYRMLELGVEPFMVANSITAILGQRLARRLCPVCREAYKPDAKLLKQAGLPADKIDCFYRPPLKPNPLEPCAKCGGLGYFGRVGVFELLVITDRMRDLIRDKASMTAIKAEARKNGMLTMKEEGLRLVVKGITNVQELLRIVK